VNVILKNKTEVEANRNINDIEAKMIFGRKNDRKKSKGQYVDEM
jgi:hypothetical protein